MPHNDDDLPHILYCHPHSSSRMKYFMDSKETLISFQLLDKVCYHSFLKLSYSLAV